MLASLKGAVAVSVSKLAAALLLVTVTVREALDWPGVTMEKAICEGVTLSPDELCAVPVSGTLTAFTPEVEEEIASVAVLEPTAAGVKITGTVQLDPAASAAPQVVVPVEKLAAEAPVI